MEKTKQNSNSETVKLDADTQGELLVALKQKMNKCLDEMQKYVEEEDQDCVDIVRLELLVVYDISVEIATGEPRRISYEQAQDVLTEMSK